MFNKLSLGLPNNKKEEIDNDLFLLQLVRKSLIAPDVVLCEFSIKEGQSFDFSAGQHLIFQIPDTHATVPRAFSIASHPQRIPSFDIILKLNDRGVASSFFRDIEAGQVVTATGPRGDFTLRSYDKPAVFIGAGAGIAPLFSMIMDIHERACFSKPMHLLFYKQEEGYEDMKMQLRALEEVFLNFKFDVITDERVCTELLNPENFSEEPEFYLCGGKQFVEDMRKQLINFGFNPQTLYGEI